VSRKKKTAGRRSADSDGWLDTIALRALESNLYERYISIIDDLVKDDPEFQRELARHAAKILERLLQRIDEKYPASP
jgi:hypothetical protein